MDATERLRHNADVQAGALRIALPAAPLRNCISHYWLCLHNTDAHCAILPDGAVDIVWLLDVADAEGEDKARGGRVGATGQHGSCNTSHHHRQPPTKQQPQVFGTTTARTLWPLLRGAHYFGIRFRPGQARHFLDVPAWALTGQAIAADEALQPSLRGLCQMGGREGEQLAAAIAATLRNTRPGSATADAAQATADAGIAAIWAQVDALLLAYLRQRPPRATCIDALIRHMQATSTAAHTWRVAPLADGYGKSRRQFERHFLDAVGLSPKRFADVLRFQRALALLVQTRWPLAQIAAELGYADQSHFSRAFARFYGQPPARARQDVAFVQDVQGFVAQNDEGLFSPL